MKKIFLVIMVVLIAASFYTWATRVSHQKEVPVIFWKSDANPQRYDQIELFHQWLVKKGHVTPDGKPKVELRLDPSNSQSSMIHAVSGVGGDMIDVSAMSRFFYNMGVTTDLTGDAKNGNYDLRHTYPGLSGMLEFNGRQHAYLCNAVVYGMWFNLNTLEKYDMPLPPEEWSPEEFESYGREFVKRANAGSPPQRIFFGQPLTGNSSVLMCIVRSKGYDFFNETLTRSTVNNPVMAETLKLLHKWTYQDKLFPTASEVASANVAGGFGGANSGQFMSGHFAMIYTGRFSLIRFRELSEPLKLHCVQPPMHEFKNLHISCRATILYAGSKHKDQAKLFLEFLADKDYNNHIIEYADGLPPNPAYAVDNPEYLNPRPNEGNVHSNELKWALNNSYTTTSSPYFNAMGSDWIVYAINKYFNNLNTAEEALKEAEQRYNAGIADTLTEIPELRESYEKALRDQKIIDECKTQGKKIPAGLIRNPFYLAYYRANDMIEE